MASREVRITSVDNPYDPFTEWDDWYFFDISKGYKTCERLASIANTSDQLTDEEINEINEEAIDTLIKTGCINKEGKIIEYKKVYKDS